MSSEVISQSEIMRKNIRAVSEMQRKATESRTMQGRISDLITDFSGSMSFVYLHAVWFGLWVLLNVGKIHVPYLTEFDPYPFGLLTLVVSLEAIFLSTFVLISQNRLACASEKRAELDLQVNLLAEQKTTKVIEMLDDIARQLDGMSKHFTFKHDPEVEALKVSPEPQEVLQVIENSTRAETKKVKEQVEKVDRAVSEVTGEVEAVKSDARRTSGKLAKVASDVEELKEEIKVKAKTGEHAPVSLR
jgi:uncharacterized membrane protein